MPSCSRTESRRAQAVLESPIRSANSTWEARALVATSRSSEISTRSSLRMIPAYYSLNALEGSPNSEMYAHFAGIHLTTDDRCGHRAERQNAGRGPQRNKDS